MTFPLSFIETPISVNEQVANALIDRPISPHKSACVNRSQKLLDNGLTGSHSGPEVRFEETAIDLLQPRFWITSELPAIRESEDRY
jgi:hypothetical protein